MKKIIGALVVLAIVAVIGLGVLWDGPSNEDKENLVIESVLEDASILITEKLHISDVFESTKGKIPFINKSEYLVHYRATIYAGLDVSEITYEQDENNVTVYIPHCKIDEESIKIGSEDITLYDTNLSIFKANSEQTIEIIGEAEKKAEAFAKNPENGLLIEADENAKEVIKQLLEAANEGYSIEVEFK